MDKALLSLKLHTPSSQKILEALAQITLPAMAGQTTILPNHSTMSIAISPGIVSTEKENIFVKGGWVNIAQNTVNLYTTEYQPVQDLDAFSLEKEIKKLQAILEQQSATEKLHTRKKIYITKTKIEALSKAL